MSDLYASGDQLQSSASRMAEWVLKLSRSERRPVAMNVPYEVHMAALEAKDAVEAWTAARSCWP